MLTGDVLPLIREAANRVYSVVRETPLAALPGHAQLPNSGMAYAKLEQLQTTGSFKLRGATNKLMSLSPQQAAAGVSAEKAPDLPLFMPICQTDKLKLKVGRDHLDERGTRMAQGGAYRFGERG